MTSIRKRRNTSCDGELKSLDGGFLFPAERFFDLGPRLQVHSLNFLRLETIEIFNIVSPIVSFVVFFVICQGAEICANAIMFVSRFSILLVLIHLIIAKEMLRI